MRMPFEQLMEQVASLSDAQQQLTPGMLGKRWGEPAERIGDAIDALRVLRGQGTYIPIRAPFGPWAALWRISRFALSLAFFAWLIWLLATRHGHPC